MRPVARGRSLTLAVPWRVVVVGNVAIGETKTARPSIYTEEYKEYSYVSPTHEEKDRSGLMTALVAGAIIALLAAVIYLFVQIDHLQTDLAKVQDKMMTAMTNEKDASAASLLSQQKRIEALKADLEANREQNAAQAKNLSAQAQKTATAHTDRKSV